MSLFIVVIQAIDYLWPATESENIYVLFFKSHIIIKAHLHKHFH